MKTLVPQVRRALISVLAGLLVLLAWHPGVQSMADAYVDTGLKHALLSFATARTLNAAISVVQSTQLSAQPLGVGVSLSVGELLDPVNDLVEQFSTLMLWASVSFGVQKALLALVGQWGLSVLFTGLIVIWAALHWRGTAPDGLTKVLLIVILVRFAVPVSALASDAVYSRTFAGEYARQQQAVEGVATKTSQAARQPVPQASEESRGLMEWLGKGLPRVDVEAMRASLQDLPERLVRLMVIFLLQTLILPLAFLWLFVRLVLGATWPVGRPRAAG